MRIDSITGATLGKIPATGSARRALSSVACGVLVAGTMLSLGGSLYAARIGPAAFQAPDAAASQTAKPAHPHHRPSPAHLAAPDSATPIAPAVPEPPKWPAFDPAAAPTVVWDSRGLSITATNASLQQILKDVATDTGAKVDGMTTDQRIFGVYGPGLAKDVLSQLLQGSGYNVIMIGDQGMGAPRQILLSARQSGPAAPAARPNQANSEDDSEAEEPAPEPEPIRPPFPVGGPPRNPQQLMQDMQQRQLQQQQQQGQPLPNQPPPQ